PGARRAAAGRRVPRAAGRRSSDAARIGRLGAAAGLQRARRHKGGKACSRPAASRLQGPAATRQDLLLLVSRSVGVKFRNMKRKKGGSVATDLRFFLQRAAAKKQSQTGNVLPSNNESQMQLVVYQGQSGKPPESVTNEQGQPTEVEPETPVMEDDDSLSVNEVNETDSSDAENDAYNIEHDPGLRTPISSYAVNDQDSVRRA
ncbi:unnamed protein product, partial [Urochloa humidicola]